MRHALLLDGADDGERAAEVDPAQVTAVVHRLQPPRQVHDAVGPAHQLWESGVARPLGEVVRHPRHAVSAPGGAGRGWEAAAYRGDLVATRGQDGQERDRQAALPYFSLPEEAQDDPVEASRWGRLAIEAVLRSKAPKKGKARADIGPGPWDG